MTEQTHSRGRGNPKPTSLQLCPGETNHFTRPAVALLALAAGLYVFFRLWQLDDELMWKDEYFTMIAVRHDWSGMIAFVVRDVVHPPLFYLLLDGWIAIGGESLLWARLLPVLISIAIIVPFLLLCRELKLRETETGLALLLVAVNGYLVAYARELRMYSLLLFLTTCSLWLFARYFNRGGGRGRPLWTLFAVNLFLIYTHYYGWLVVGVELLFLLFYGRRRWLPFAFSFVLLGLCFAPWAYAVTKAAIAKQGLEENLGWISPPDLSDVTWYFGTLNGPQGFPHSTSLGLLLFGLPIVWWGVRILREGRHLERSRIAVFAWFCLFAFLPVAIVFVASHLFAQSGWGSRYLVIAAVPYLLLVSAAAGRLRPLPLRFATLALLVGWAGLSGFRELVEEEGGVDWEPLVGRMEAVETSQERGIRIYTLGGFLVRPLQFHLQPSDTSRFTIEAVEELAEVTASPDDHFWVGYRNQDWEREPAPQRILAGRGFTVGETLSAAAGGAKTFLFPVWRSPSGVHPGAGPAEGR